MRHLFLMITAFLVCTSCDSNTKRITQKEFNYLLTHNSIATIHLFNNKEVEIKLKSVQNNDNIYILPIDSKESFKLVMDKQTKAMAAQHICLTYQMIESSGKDPYYLFLLYPLLLLLTLIAFLLTVIDILKNSFNTATEKLMWFFVVFLLPIIGPILYICIGRMQKVSKSK